MNTIEFKKIVNGSTLLKQEVKDKLIDNAQKISPAKREKIALIIIDGENKKQEINKLYEESLSKLAKQYLDKIKEFKRTELPKLRKLVESKERGKEEIEAEEMLENID